MVVVEGGGGILSSMFKSCLQLSGNRLFVFLEDLGGSIV